MNELKYQITQLIFIVLLGFGAYWALTHLDNGLSYSREHIVDQSEISKESPSESELDLEIPSPETTVDPNPTTPPLPDEVSQPEPSLSTEDQALVDALGRLIDDEIYMKVGSRGTRVGTVQKFLARYFSDQKVSVDNEYGPGTKNLVEKFQGAEGLSPDGQAGPNTYKKMIEIIKKA